MKRNLTATIAMLIITTILSLNSAYALEGLPSNIQTPKDLAEWLSDEFQYTFEINDNWQSAQTTIDSRSGDCEDFAVLVSSVLTDHRISNDIVLVDFKGMQIRHAICAWRTDNGTYNFISNKVMYTTSETSLESAIKKYYPDAKSITLAKNDYEFRKKMRSI
ncbi:MAG: transglutaminase-like domain-containing protein [Candidatus Omnitrophica bacterium]|nr:transglutaminase-like domain-containing protein [Candidatus Omnitrophota bacterium]